MLSPRFRTSNTAFRQTFGHHNRYNSGMTGGGKWIADVSPSDLVSEVAKRSLRARLEIIPLRLELAAFRAEEDREHVHRLRVAARRGVAAIDVFRSFLPPRKAAWLRHRLKRIRQAAGPARDCDVLTERWEKILADQRETAQIREQLVPMLAVIARRRQEAQLPIVEIQRTTTADERFDQKLEKLLAGIRPRRKKDKDVKKLTFADWSRRKLRKYSEKFFVGIPHGEADFEELHQFRIRTKKLRYALELLSRAFPAKFRKQSYPIVQELQTHLGAINDHFSAIRSFQQWQQSPDAEQALREAGVEKSDLFCSLIEEEQSALDRSTKEFRDWWTKDQIEALRTAFTKVDANE